MVTGHGFYGGRGRCYSLWMDYMACATKHGSYGRGVCQLEKEDYDECLHGKKLVRVIDIKFIVLGVLTGIVTQIKPFTIYFCLVSNNLQTFNNYRIPKNR